VIDYGIKGESIICFAGEDWWYHHPHSKNHILKRLARENTVLFVNSITLGLPSLSNPDFFLKIRRKLKSYTRWLKEVPEGLFVMTPFSLPFFGSRIVCRLNRVLLRMQIRLAMMICKMRNPIIWAAIPSAADVVGDLNAKLVLYQVSDKYDALEDTAVGASRIREMDRRLMQMAALVVYSGRRLYEESEVKHKYLLEQAVDFDHFAVEAPGSAPEISAIPHPVIGYMGGIDYLMDIALIEKVSRERPDWHWVLLGLKSNLVNIDSPNVHFLGSKPYSDLPAYIRHWDVCVLPWRQEHEVVKYGSAIKVREYMATGKPVVICAIYEYLKTPGLRIYHSVEEFIALVEDALKNDTPRAKQIRRDAVRNCTWDQRAGELGFVIKCCLHSGPNSIPASQRIAWNEE